MERREYFIPPTNQINFQMDVPFEKISSAIIPIEEPSRTDFVTIRVENTLGKNSVNVISDREQTGNGISLSVSQRSRNVNNAELIRVEKNSKISIVRADARLYNIRSIKVYDENDILVEESNANTFDFDQIDRDYRIVVDSYDVVSTEDYPSFITSINQGYVWNTEYSSEFVLKIGVSNSTEFVRYYFPNQIGVDELGSKRIVPVNNEVLINLSNPNALGRFELVILAGNRALGERDEVRTFIDVIREKTYGEPDVTQIIYDRNIIEADLRPLDFNFEFDLESVNSEGIEILLGDNKISEIYPQNNKSKTHFYAKDLYNSFKDYFNETAQTYLITFGFRPFFNGIGGKIYGKTESVSITVQRTKFLIDKGTAVRDISSVFSQLFSGGDSKTNFEDQIVFEDDKHLYYQVRLSADQSYVIANTGMDRLTFSVLDGKVVETQFEIDSETGSTRKKKGYLDYGSLVIKLLEPLPPTIDLNTQVWVSKQIIPTIVESIIITDEDDDKCLPLKPNFGTDVINETGLQYFDEIISSGSVTSTQIVNKYISQSLFNLEELDINYTSGSDKGTEYFLNFENFVNFGSALTRIENFQYKIETIEDWNNKINTTLYSGSVLSTSTDSLLTSASYDNKIQLVKNGFDGFEKKMYNDFSITSSVDTFFTSQSVYAEIYDRSNKNYLVKHIPQYIQESSDNLEYLTFLEMIGQHFDIIWSYINGINRVKKVENKAVDGISDKLVYELLESFGWDPKSPFEGKQLWNYAFGLNDNNTSNSNVNLLGNNVSTSYTPEEARKQVWRRILNNLPYLLKHKGTRKSINAILSCYGVPSSLLTIVEFGGPSNTPSDTNKFTYEDRSAFLNVSGSDRLTLPWINGTPNSVQLRFKTNNKVESEILRGVSGSNYWKVSIEPTGSALFGNVNFEIVTDKVDIDVLDVDITTGHTSSMSIDSIPLYDNEFKFITVQKTTTSDSDGLMYDTYTMYLREALGDRLKLSKSSSITLQVSSSASYVDGNTYYSGSNWDTTGTLYINGSGSSGLNGSIDEFRLWNTALSSSVITSHTLNPDVIFGNHVSSSTDDLLFRLDFEYPKNLYLTASIKNVAPITSSYWGGATASFTSNYTASNSYPYQYESYERFVTAEVPQIGFVGKDKVRLEDIELTGQLSYKQRATKKAFDRAPIDSNRLGLFFSPVKELNLDILRSLGTINIGDYIGDWGEEYGTDNYNDLVNLRNYYFQRTNLNFDEYIKLIKSVDKSLFDMLEQVIPARANISKGILIEPSILDRSKIKINRPVAENIYHSASFDLTQTQNISLEIPYHTASLDMEVDKEFEATTPFYTSSYDLNELVELNSSFISYEGNDTIVSDELVKGDITYNSGSTMGGIEIMIDAGLRNPTILGEYDLEESYQQVGNEADSPFNLGFGLFGERGALDRTYFREDGSLVLTQRYNAYIITVRYGRYVPKRVPANGLSSSLYNTSKLGANDKIEVELKYRFEKKLVLVDPIEDSVFQTPTNHSFYTGILSQLGVFPYKNGIITDIQIFDGYTSGHYRYTKDTARGLENSFYMGSKQTSLTTIDGTSAVEVFVTNPNRLRVAASGRGSGEPILEVD
jgi:hypothetical protein